MFFSASVLFPLVHLLLVNSLRILITSTTIIVPPYSPGDHDPCTPCKILRRRCVEKCILAPYFPPTDPYKFTITHRVFGASNIIKFLQDLPESQRADGVSSMVYEASARIRDPVYGCARPICQLQKHVSDLQEKLARAQAAVVNRQCQRSNLFALIRMSQFQEPSAFLCQQFEVDASGLFDDGCSLSSADWPESLWPLS